MRCDQQGNYHRCPCFACNRAFMNDHSKKLALKSCKRNGLCDICCTTKSREV